jgi:membrane protein YdbS with pleckstrin-like domain
LRAYSASNEEARRARDLLKDWAGEGFLTEAQRHPMEQETVCELRRTNIFLRLVLFLFTLIIAGAAVALFFVVFLPHSERQATGILLLFFAAISYGAAELAVSQARLYRYGIEEALAACSVGFLCAGMSAAFFSGPPDGTEFLIPAAGAIASLWIWNRFGLFYAFLAAMIFIVWLPGYWTSSHSAQHMIVAAFYAVGLLAVIAVRPRHRFTYLNDEYSIAEALLWLGIYLAINLQLSPVNLLGQWWGGLRTTTEFSRPFYWATWVLTWCLPPIVLGRGVRKKDRFVIAVGAIVGILTLVTNKPYLGWQRHTWDPMLLGALLIGVALFIRRWLADGPGEIRQGFTAKRLSGKDKSWMNAGTAAFGLVSPSTITPSAQTGSPDVDFGGGDSGGGGASSDF